MRKRCVGFAAKALGLFVILGGATVLVNAQPAAQRAVHMGDRRASEADNESTRKPKREPKDVLAEVNEDLARLLELNKAIASFTTTSGDAPNYKSISENLVEVNKRSTRLRTSLALPKAEGEKNSFKNAEKDELAPALGTLNKLLDGFLHNPVFSDTGAIDPQLAAKAGRDLDDLIVLSEKLRKNAEKRSKLAS